MTAPECKHPFVNMTTADDGKVTAKCAACGAPVIRKHHTEMAKLYNHGGDSK